MIDRIRHFCDFFKDFPDSYVIIGGAACSAWYDGQQPHFRPTHDLDIVLILENLDSPFIERFRDYVERCGYAREQVGQADKRHPCMYRFSAPVDEAAPERLELLSRKGDFLRIAPGQHRAPLKAEGEYTGFSSILLDDTYYRFLREHRRTEAGIPRPRLAALIALKIKAYLNIREERQQGGQHGSDGSRDTMNKHRNDVFFLLLDLTPETDAITLPPAIREDVRSFIDLMQQGVQEEAIFANLRRRRSAQEMAGLSLDLLLDALATLFRLQA